MGDAQPGRCLFESSGIFRYIDEMEKNDPMKIIGLSVACRAVLAAGADEFA
jgi:preprotein translocase subunit Sec61beta